jgi:hypothetical protein
MLSPYMKPQDIWSLDLSPARHETAPELPSHVRGASPHSV